MNVIELARQHLEKEGLLINHEEDNYAAGVLEGFIAGWDERAEHETMQAIMRDSDLEILQRRAKKMPETISQSFKKLTESDKHNRYYLAECRHCGWWGSSRLLEGGGFLVGCDDYDDVACPLCGSNNIEDKEE